MFKELNLDDYTRTHIQVMNSFPRLPHLITSYLHTLHRYTVYRQPLRHLKKDHAVIPKLRSLLPDNPPSPGEVGHTTGVYFPSSFSNSGVGSFTSHKNQISESAVRRDLRLFVLIEKSLVKFARKGHYFVITDKKMTVYLVSYHSISLQSPAAFKEIFLHRLQKFKMGLSCLLGQPTRTHDSLHLACSRIQPCNKSQIL